MKVNTKIVREKIMSIVINMKRKIDLFLFENTEIAFLGKSDRDLKRSYWLFKIISVNFLTFIGPSLIGLALRMRLPVKGILRRTIFRHFCGGENIEECKAYIQRLADVNVGTILDYSIEGDNSEAVFDAAWKEILRTVTYAAAHRYIPFTVFKPTGLGRFSLFEKLGSAELLTEEESAEFERIQHRLNSICQLAYELDVKVLIDAEHSWIQDNIDVLTLGYMKQYNIKKAIIFNTYQLYRHDKLASLKSDCSQAESEGYFLGAKLVRGAYMEIERLRAQQKGYPSPIHESKEATDKDYDAGILFCLDRLSHVSFVAGTHNEQSCRFLATEMKNRNIGADHPQIFFAQLYGMSDHLTFNLAYRYFNVAKYMPYGNIEEVMPYLFRRAQENTSVAGQAGRELVLITKEIKRRKKANAVRHAF
jgi:proline dehydrogenase